METKLQKAFDHIGLSQEDATTSIERITSYVSSDDRSLSVHLPSYLITASKDGAEAEVSPQKFFWKQIERNVHDVW